MKTKSHVGLVGEELFTTLLDITSLTDVVKDFRGTLFLPSTEALGAAAELIDFDATNPEPAKVDLLQKIILLHAVPDATGE